MPRRSLRSLELWSEEKNLHQPISISPSELSYARRVVCYKCGGSMVEVLADCKPPPAEHGRGLWIIDSWCDDCYDLWSWQGQPFPHFTQIYQENRTSYEYAIGLSYMIWHGELGPMWYRYDHKYKKSGRGSWGPSTEYPTLRQAMSVKRKESARLAARQLNALFIEWYGKKAASKKSGRHI